MVRQQGCEYAFEWATPLVCPDATQTNGCTLTDDQLQFTFDLAALSGEVSVAAGADSFKINVCGAVSDAGCKGGAVCQLPGAGGGAPASYGISQAMTMDYRHEEQGVLMQYGGGDPCPTGKMPSLRTREQ